MNYTTDKDGVEYINIYSQGRTKLGVLLSNFTHVPGGIKTEDGVFMSVEAYWYWLGTVHPQRDYLRAMHGWRVKAQGREMRRTHPNMMDAELFQNKIKRSIVLKVNLIPELKQLMIENELPYVHYYVMQGTIRVPKDNTWVIEFIEKLATVLKEQQ
jgi:hypothetical protein